jgi:phosphoenolpyruvate carboxykinase (ATP)
LLICPANVKAVELAQKFKANFEKFEEFANEEILAGAPKA